MTTLRPQSEQRMHVRELIANRGPMTTREIAAAIGETVRKTANLMNVMARTWQVKPIGKAQAGEGNMQNIWALRCYRGEFQRFETKR